MLANKVELNPLGKSLVHDTIEALDSEQDRWQMQHSRAYTRYSTSQDIWQEVEGAKEVAVGRSAGCELGNSMFSSFFTNVMCSL